MFMHSFLLTDAVGDGVVEVSWVFWLGERSVFVFLDIADNFFEPCQFRVLAIVLTVVENGVLRLFLKDGLVVILFIDATVLPTVPDYLLP